MGDAIADWFAPPPGAAWWYRPAAAGLLAVLAAALAAAVAPVAVAPLTAAEREVVRRSRGRRWRFLYAAAGGAAVLLLAAAVLALGPRPPRVVVYQSVRVAADPAFGPAPAARPGLSRIDAGPAVRRVLAAAAAPPHAAADWYVMTADRVAALRELCRAELDSPGDADPPAADGLPGHLVTSVELSVVLGLAHRENAPLVRVRVAVGAAEWELAKDLMPAGVELEVSADAPARTATILRLFDGRRLPDGTVWVRALLADPAAVDVRADVVDGAGATRLALARPPAATPARVVELTGSLPGPAAGWLTAVAEGGACRTPIADVGPPRELPVTGPAAADLAAAVNAAVAVGEWRAAWDARGWPAVQAVARGPAAGEPAVHTLTGGRGVLVLPPGLDPVAVAVPDRVAPPPALTPSFAVRPSVVLNTGADVDSVMSVGVRVPADGRLPPAADALARLASGGRMDGPLDGGRQLAAAAAEVTVPAIELGTAGDRVFVLVRLDPGEHKLFAPWPDPVAARAFVASLLWAVDRVAGPPPAPPAAAPPARPLLSHDDRAALLAARSAGPDAVAVMAAAAVLGAAAGRHLGRRPRVQ